MRRSGYIHLSGVLGLFVGERLRPLRWKLHPYRLRSCAVLMCILKAAARTVEAVCLATGEIPSALHSRRMPKLLGKRRIWTKLTSSRFNRVTCPEAPAWPTPDFLDLRAQTTAPPVVYHRQSLHRVGRVRLLPRSWISRRGWRSHPSAAATGSHRAPARVP